MLSLAKNIELWQVLPKIWSSTKILPKLLKYVKFWQKYGVIPSFSQYDGNMLSFAKKMKLCQVLPKLWNYVKFCQKYGIVLKI